MIDVLVAGGGPVGLATAIGAARAGLKTAIIEPRSAPIDKACGEGLMPGAVRALADLGIVPAGHRFAGIRYVSGDDTATATFTAGPGLGVPRRTLHAALHRAASDAGIEMITDSVTSVEQDADGVRVCGLRARYLVGADGLHSRVRRLTGLDDPPAPGTPKRWGIRMHYKMAPWTDHVEVHWSPVGEAYVTPLGPDLVGVAVLTDRRLSYDCQLIDLPLLRERLTVPPVCLPRGAGPLRQRSRARVAGRVALVGDAAGYVDALTGEGLAIGFSSAASLVERMVSGDLAAYERDHRRITRRYRLITSALLSATEHPSLRRHVVPAARHLPRLYQGAVDTLAG